MYNNFPVIGILAINNNKIQKFKIDYSIVKWIKNQGCYVVYISPRLDKDTIVKIFNNIDGLIIPGGEDDAYDTNETYMCAKILIDLAYEHGNFPIIGICLGLQYLLTHYSGDIWENINTYIKHHNQSNKLLCETDLTNTILHNLSKERLSEKHFFFNHNYSINIETYHSHPKLLDTFNVLSTTEYNNNRFLSTIQGKNQPFFGLAWHPEKPNFEWVNHQKIIRTPESIEIGRNISIFFIEYCKLTNNKTELSIINEYDIELKPQYLFQTTNPDDSEYDEPLLVYLI
jgi:gamma-glutamyl hydrolase